MLLEINIYVFHFNILGSGKADVFGANIVRSHQWFQDVDWDDIEAKSFVPEWQPIQTLSGKMDLRCN